MDYPVSLNHLPTALYRAEQVRELDRIAIDEFAIDAFELMWRAGTAVFELFAAVYPSQKTLSVFCGKGNNGGDGYVIATLAARQGIEVEVIALAPLNSLSGAALQAWQLAQSEGIVPRQLDQWRPKPGTVVIDALLGTGLSGAVRGDVRTAIEQINRSELPVIAVDLPSGICADSGRVLAAAIMAQHTVCFIGLKRGLITGQAPDHTGIIHFAGLDVPSEVYAQVPASAERLHFPVLRDYLPKRRRCAHKGDFGHVMIIGGDRGMAGAAALAASSATRAGAGLTSCATRPEHVTAIVSRSPEVMVHGVVSGQQLLGLLERATVLVVGPGLGQGAWGQQLLQQVGLQDKAMVVDADALNLLASGNIMGNNYRDNWILTPHPGEAARLLNCTTEEVQRDRFAAAQALQHRYGGAVVLKGAGTLVVSGGGEPMAVSCYGNPGMASGGMGDVLSGVLGALLAQGLDIAQAARLGVCLHGSAADLAALKGECGMLASDLIAHFRELLQ
ncbi:MAG: hydroxyethylthiazole kinase-like uncharacterized protein yjeF [Paraglaciecola psychrophila]|jgi:hydroxyethylthiazole kinase-like uncharacterized protein yjeF